MPRVSVLIPSYNLAPFIGEAIESVLAQTFTDWHLIIEDDGSTDDSVNVITAYMDRDSRITLIAKADNQGQNETTNNLCRVAQGDYICLLAADDVFAPDKLALQVEYLDAHPECSIAFGQPQFIGERGELREYPIDGIVDIGNAEASQWLERLKHGNCLFVSTSMYRRSLHAEIGYFDESLPLLADLDFYIRAIKAHGAPHVIEQPLAKIRQRDGMANLSAPTEARLEQNADELESVRERNFPVDRSRRKIMLATPFYEVKGYAPYIRSLVQTVASLERVGLAYEWGSRMGDSYVWRARNAMAQTFMDSDATELFFIDSDQGWSLESFFRVLKADVDIVGGAYPVKNNWEMYGVTFHTVDGDRPDVREDGLIRGDKVPTGFMKIKRRVFEMLRAANPHDWYWDGGRKVFNFFGHIVRDHTAYGEDISFNLRWQAIGGQIWIEPRCDISHLGTKTWNGNLHEFLLKQPGGSESAKPVPPQLKLVA